MINHQGIFRNQICSLESLQNHYLKEHRGALQHQKLSIDLNLSDTQCTNDDRTLSGDSFAPEVYSLTEHGIYKPSAEGIELSLTADGERTYEDKFICSLSLQSFRHGRDHITIHAHDSEVSCSSKSWKNSSFDWIPGGDGRATLSGRNHFYQGVEECHKEASCSYKLARQKLYTSRKVEELDLNKPPPNESFAGPSEPWIIDPSQFEHSDVSHVEVGEYGNANNPNCMDFRPEKAESKLRSPGKTCRRPLISELNVKKKEDNLSSHCWRRELVEGTDSNRSPVSCKSDLIRDDVLSNKKGADSLLYLSSQCLGRDQDSPQTSSESYESIVLKQVECSIDEYCISSTPFKVASLDKNEHRVKLKRGRRMKDFRKEILPGLGSLSRKEINEDIKTMDVALRSREYKKYRSKIASKSECNTPVRSRRS